MADQHARLFSRRFQNPVAKTNLIEVDDYPEPLEGATPRSFVPGTLWVEHMDMLKTVNMMEHRTLAYNINKLVVRRGQHFRILVTFSQDVASDDVRLEFLIGSNPNPVDDTRVTVSFGWHRPSKSGWTGEAVQQYGSQLELAVRPSPWAIMGKYRCYVVVNTGGHTVRSRRNDATDIYVLFNPWCKEDGAYYPREQDLQEYVLNDSGIIFQGTENSILHRNWLYGQFEKGILDACIYILDAAQMPIKARGNLTCVIRKASAALNSQDDNGVMQGNWSDDYSQGIAPTKWTGSVEILKKYASTGNPVSFAQCWVFAGVFTTFLRCLGIASRTITNFSSAHDNTGNLRVDLLFRGNVIDNINTLDSIWNYHCWNEVYIKRVDLPPRFSGWQAVDATPQETSEGRYRCGPASLTAIKTGEVSYGYDTKFIIAEVNSDVVHHRYEDGEYTVFKVDKTHVGKLICTKAVGSHNLMDITNTYKYCEGTEENQNALDLAEARGMMRDHTVIEEEEPLRVNIHVNEVYRGQNIEMMVNIQNLTRSDRQFHGRLDVATEYYTGVSDKPFYHQDIDTEVKVNEAWQFLYMLNFEDFRQHIFGVHTLQVSIIGEVDTRLVTEIKLIELKLHAPTVVVSGDRHINGLVTVTVTYKNDSGDILTDVDLAISGTDMDHALIIHHDTVEMEQSISQMIQVRPSKLGHYTFIGKVILQNVYEASGAQEFDIDS
ncbi:coagulation factor XIII A chain-like [Nelusetta ayraudi]|uniref:coagulation factor XIII A chain-like n=1 Tax=Nelusetta ayraudi TaxID=303726 RepID=UPI003F713FF6